CFFFFFQAEDGIRDFHVTGVQTCALPISSQALRLWHDVTMSLVTDGDKDLTSRQMAILMTVYLEPPPHTVRGLAARLDVTKPVRSEERRVGKEGSSRVSTSEQQEDKQRH